MQNIYFPMRILFPLGLMWIFLLFKLNWHRLNLSRLMFLSFIALFLSFFPAIYAPIEAYQEGLNYVKTHHVSIWGTPGIPSSGLLIVLGVTFLGFSMLRVNVQIYKKFNHKLKNNELSNWQRIYWSILLITYSALLITYSAILALIATFFRFLFVGFPFTLLALGMLNSRTGGYIPALIVGILMILLATEATIRQKAVMLLVLFVHLSILLTYSQSLPLKEQSSFYQGFAEAVKKDVDIKSIHQWMASQHCSSASDSSFEIDTDYMGTDGERDREKFKQLPAAIRNTKPRIVFFDCAPDEAGQSLSLSFPLWGDSGWDLIFLYPPVSSEILEKIHERYRTPRILDDCSCYIRLY